MLITGGEGSGKSFSTTILKSRLRKGKDLVINVTSEILRTADFQRIAEQIVKQGERELQLKSVPESVLRPAAAMQRYDQHDALFDVLRRLADQEGRGKRLLWLVLDIGRDGLWTTANDALLKNLSIACAAHPWLRLVIIGTSLQRAGELRQLFQGVTVDQDDVSMVQADEYKEHAAMLVAKHPGQINSSALKKYLTALWNEIEEGSRTTNDRNLRCVAAVCSILKLRDNLLRSRGALP
jgi:hypothetical protein